MIELRQDQLRFAFPEIAHTLRELVNAHLLAHRSRLLAEDRTAALDALFRGRWRPHNADASFRAEAVRRATAFSADEIAEAFSHLACDAADLDREASEVADDAGPATLAVEFQRTLRIPDDGRTYPLPPGLGRFPLRHVDDFAERLPTRWQERGGVLMPMFQAEALWLNFRSLSGYPFALKIAAGKINAVSAEAWRTGLHRKPAQDYVVIPGQPWLDGFAVRRGVIRQFVAMPLGSGYSVEEQLTGTADTGGIQLQAHPLRAEIYFKESVAPQLPRSLADVLAFLIPEPRMKYDTSMVCESMPAPCMAASSAPDMGLGAGGQMRQEIYADRRPLADWDIALGRRCFVHLCNTMVWREITGSAPPQPPVTANEYSRAGLPWFDYYNEDFRPLPGGKAFAKVRSIFQLGKKKGDVPLPGNESVTTPQVVPVGPAKRHAGEVREWRDE